MKRCARPVAALPPLDRLSGARAEREGLRLEGVQARFPLSRGGLRAVEEATGTKTMDVVRVLLTVTLGLLARMAVRFHEGDIQERLSSFADGSFDALLSDPPYHFTNGKKGGTGAKSVNLASPQGRSRISTGFMGTAWDGGDIAFRPDLWRAVLRVLKPGAFALVFGGTRTFHRLAVALEDAGFELRDTLAWLYSSGMPKSHNVGAAMAKAGDTTWSGYGTALAPAWEPILLVRKPTPLTFAENAAVHGAGALNIDGSRIPFEGFEDEREAKAKNRHGDFDSGPMTNFVYGEYSKDRENYDPRGRWPKNVLVDDSDEVAAAFTTDTPHNVHFLVC